MKVACITIAEDDAGQLAIQCHGDDGTTSKRVAMTMLAMFRREAQKADMPEQWKQARLALLYTNIALGECLNERHIMPEGKP